MKELFTKSIVEIKAYFSAHEEELLHHEEFRYHLKNDSRKALVQMNLQMEKNQEKALQEVLRVKALYDFDLSFDKVVCGVDEVGRGPLAGPIVGAAVILERNSNLENLILGINDSKKLSKKKREELDLLIREKALCFAIYEMSNLDIDRLGISYCNHEVFRASIRNLSLKPQLVLSDGYRVKDYHGENKAIIKGDMLSASIACASIIAKVHRDRLMERLSLYYPEYGFESNVGYGSPGHLRALREFGPTPLHRVSFISNLVSSSKEE